MKIKLVYLLLSVLISFMISACSSKEELVEPVKTIEPVTQSKFYDKNGNLLYEIISNINGKLEKNVYTYYENNNLKSKTKYINDIKNGPQIRYYPTGKVFKRSYFLKGLEDGKNVAFYKNGNMKYEVYMTFGKFHGFAKEYYENGNKKSIATYKLGKIRSMKTFTKDGNVKKDLKRGSGEVKAYSASGELKSTVTYFRGKIINSQEYEID